MPDRVKSQITYYGLCGYILALVQAPIGGCWNKKRVEPTDDGKPE
jgi:hypothetical protein